jgi:hypothetical protein
MTPTGSSSPGGRYFFARIASSPRKIISLEVRFFTSAPLRAAALIALPDFQAMQINDH